uniref:Uncharacterized protein n=1 Tax=Tanacetum cinerariifolium TaxID=118510 RepID=A0A6L2JR30_TANCI|nr:hypothetical protein [Tanacetum cinerariifolium]
MGTCFPSLYVIKTAPMASFAAARYIINSSFSFGTVNIGSSAINCFIPLHAISASAVHWKSLFFMHFFNVLKNGKDFSADLDRNLFRLASFSFSFCTSFRHFGDGRLRTASTLFGHTLSPSASTLYPRKLLMTRSSTYTSKFQPICFWKALSTKRWRLPPFFCLTGGVLTIRTALFVIPLSRAYGYVCFEYSGWIATNIFSSVTWLMTGRGTLGSETIEHFSGMILLLRSEKGDLITMKFIRADVECSLSLIFTSNDICPRGHIISLEPPFTYMRCTQCPLISALMIIGPSVPSSSSRVGKEITDSKEKV